MAWQLAILVHQLLESIYLLLYRRYAQHHSGEHYVTNAAIYLLTVVPFGIAASAVSGASIADVSLLDWLLLGVAGVLFALSNGLAFMANEGVGASRFSIINNSSTIVAIISASLVLHETLSFVQYVGGSLLLLASLFAIRIRDSAGSGPRRKLRSNYVLAAVVSATCLGLALTNERHLLVSIGLGSYLILGWSFQAVCMAFLARLDFRRIWSVSRRSFRSIAILGALRTAAGFMLLYALATSGNASIVAAAMSFQSVIVAVGAYYFLNERENVGWKLIAAIGAGFGLLLVLL